MQINSLYWRPLKFDVNGTENHMKKLLVLVAAFAVGMVFADSQSYEDEVAERLVPAGGVCVEGEECAVASASVVADAGPKSGDEVYNSACVACHGTGALNAPKLGDAGAWSARQAQGIDVLYSHAIDGFNTMPARGGNSALSDEDVIAAVDHMLSAL